MEKDLIGKVLNWNDFAEAAANSVIVFGVGKATSIALNKFFGINIDKFNSVEHAAMGIGIGTYAYRRAGGGIKGFGAAAVATTFILGSWEAIEYNIPSYREGLIDSVSDMAVAYVSSNVLAPLAERIKDYLEKRNKKE